MKKELKYLASRRLGKVGHQGLHSAPYKKEIDPLLPNELVKTKKNLLILCRFTI
jgi:hypothetical protein